MPNINRTKYHELNLLLWDMHKKYVDPRTAFQLYEKRWAYVDQNRLSDEEHSLIKRLTRAFGNGHFMPAV